MIRCSVERKLSVQLCGAGCRVKGCSHIRSFALGGVAICDQARLKRCGVGCRDKVPCP